MIELTRLNGSPLYVNCDLIKWAEAAPDTMLTLINGEKVVVREPCAEVVERMLRQRVRVFTDVMKLIPTSDALLRVLAAETFATPQIRNIVSETQPSASDEEPQTG